MLLLLFFKSILIQLLAVLFDYTSFLHNIFHRVETIDHFLATFIPSKFELHRVFRTDLLQIALGKGREGVLTMVALTHIILALDHFKTALNLPFATGGISLFSIRDITFLGV